MKSYVLILCVRPNFYLEDEILCIKKDRPEWQKGRLNLPGGKIESGESALDAASRELLEETGLEGKLKQMGVLIDGESHIHCFVTQIAQFSKLKPREGETEPLDWFTPVVVLRDSRLIPNLKVIIPLMMLEVSGWTINDSELSEDKPHHSFSISLS